MVGGGGGGVVVVGGGGGGVVGGGVAAHLHLPISHPPTKLQLPFFAFFFLCILELKGSIMLQNK